MRTSSQPPQPVQESVWDYPRPPRLEPAPRRIRVVFGRDTLRWDHLAFYARPMDACNVHDELD